MSIERGVAGGLQPARRDKPDRSHGFARGDEPARCDKPDRSHGVAGVMSRLDAISPTGVKGLRGVMSLLDDRLNPIVVKELRQAVQGRFLAGILIFFLALQLLTLGIFLLNRGISSIDLVGGESYGQEVFAILAGILFFAVIFCIPVYAAVRIYSERAGDQMALFFLSTLAPHRIVLGKLLSNLVLSLLLFSACLPYLSFTYYLRGIDLPTVFVALATGLLASVAAIQGAIFLASLPVSRLLRVLIGLAGLFSLMILFLSVLGLAMAMGDSGVGSLLTSWEFWRPALAVLAFGTLIFGLAFSLTVAIVTHVAANRARPVRIYSLAAWLASGAAIAYACLAHSERELAAVWLTLVLSLLAGSLLTAICGRDRMSSRVRGEIPASPIGRAVSFFLFSGSANGLAFSGLLIALTVAAGELFDRHLGRALDGLHLQLLGFCGYVFSYSLLAVLLQRRWLGRYFKRPNTWVLALVLAALFSLTPPIIGFLFSPDAVARSIDQGLWTILNPFAPFQFQTSELATRFSLGWAAVMTIFTGAWFVAQIRAFRAPAGLESEAEVLEAEESSAHDPGGAEG